MFRSAFPLLLVASTLLTQGLSAYRCAGGCDAACPAGTPHVYLDDLVRGKAAEAGCGCRRHPPTRTEKTRDVAHEVAGHPDYPPAGCPWPDGDCVLILLPDDVSGESCDAPVCPDCPAVHPTVCDMPDDAGRPAPGPPQSFPTPPRPAHARTLPLVI